jgi:hypothetical protein
MEIGTKNGKSKRNIKKEKRMRGKGKYKDKKKKEEIEFAKVI